jgi:hypothetical protein
MTEGETPKNLHTSFLHALHHWQCLFQKVVRVPADCDEDCLIQEVEQTGAACHRGYPSCFFRTLDGTVVGTKVFDPGNVYGKKGTECFSLCTCRSKGNSLIEISSIALLMVSPGYSAVRVEPGTHLAVFTYRPPFYRFPLMITGLVILFLPGLVQWRKNHLQ